MARRLKRAWIAAVLALFLGLVCATVAATPQRSLHAVLGAWFAVHGVHAHGAEVRGIPLHWYGGGAGDRAVLLLHGAGGDAATTWYSLLPALAGRARVVAPNLSFANMRAVAGNEAYSFERELNSVRLLLGELGIRRVLVVGVSVGGWLALRLAAESPDLVRGVVAVAPAGPNLAGLAERMAAVGRSPGGWFFERLFRHPPPVPDFLLREQIAVIDSWAGTLPGLAATFSAPGRDPDLTLHRVAAPVTLVWGRGDRILPPSDAEYYLQRLPGARLETLDDCGHAVVWDQPERLRAVVLAALAGEGA